MNPMYRLFLNGYAAYDQHVEHWRREERHRQWQACRPEIPVVVEIDLDDYEF